MAVHAIDNIEAAVTVTRRFLLPFALRRWVKLAVVVFFIGSGLSFPSFQFNVGDPTEQIPVTEIPVTLPADVATIIGVVALSAVLLALVFALIGAIMEFVFIESLRHQEVAVRRYWSGRWRQGLRLFGFRIVIGLPVLLMILGWLALLVVPIVTGADLTLPVGLFVVFIPILLVIGVLYGFVASFTTVFVVPLMIKDDTGVLAAWRRLLGSIRSAWKQYLAYAVVAFLLTFGIGLIAAMFVGLAGLLLLIPFAIIAVMIVMTVSLSSTFAIATLVGMAIVFGVLLTVIWALVQVPVVTYLRYYALLVLGDIEASFDLIPEQRQALER